MLSLSARKEFQIQTSILRLSEQNKEKAMATHSSSLAWKIPWTEEPGRLQSMGSLRVRHDWATSRSLFPFMHWRRKWQPTPVFLPWESQGQGKPGGLPSMGSHRVGHNWNDLAAAAAEQNNFQINSTKLPGVYTMLSSQYPISRLQKYFI